MCEFSLERKVFKQFRLTFELFIALQGINKCILFPSFSLSLSAFHCMRKVKPNLKANAPISVNEYDYIK